MDGWMDGWMDGCMSVRMYVPMYICICMHEYVLIRTVCLQTYLFTDISALALCVHMCSPVGMQPYINAAGACLPASGAQIVVSLPNLETVVLVGGGSKH